MNSIPSVNMTGNNVNFGNKSIHTDYVMGRCKGLPAEIKEDIIRKSSNDVAWFFRTVKALMGEKRFSDPKEHIKELKNLKA